ncbi:MAG: hypothetical protein EOO74_02315, partial [Myxococcales bacterium]
MPHRHQPSSDDRSLLDGAAGALFREIVTEGGLDARHDRFADGADKDSLATLLHLGLVVKEKQRLLAVDPALVQSRIVGPIGQRAAELQVESAAWATTLSDLSQDFRRTTVARNPIDEIQGGDNINRFLESVVG